MYLIKITGLNLSGATVVAILGNDQNKNATVSDFSLPGDGSVFEEVEFLDANTKRYFSRKLVSRVIGWTTGRQHASPGEALAFCRDHRSAVPLQGLLTVAVPGATLTASNACVRIASMVAFGVRTVTRYEVMFGDFD